jgi:3-dehydroquinate synthetase/predicted NBD/HSP70 family sugar kinase
MRGFLSLDQSGDEVIAFDLGGTSFRSALLTKDGKLSAVQRIPSINYRSLPGKSAAEIIDAIASYIAGTVTTFWSSEQLAIQRSHIGISMGAALNAHTGVILASGPILGNDSRSIDLESAIRRYLPGGLITIVNDVTAALVAHSLLPSFRHTRRLALITVSSGIAARTLSCSVPHVPVDSTLGTQGEIGHHRISFSLDGHPLSLKCDCGGIDHLNAFASGNGIKNVLTCAREIFPQDFRNSRLRGSDLAQNGCMRVLREGLEEQDPFCRKILMAVTAPVGEAIKWHYLVDPEIDNLILTGGVCAGLGDYYRSAVLENLSTLDFYPLTSNRESFWNDRVVQGPFSDDAGLIGAAYISRESPTIHRRETLSAPSPFRVSRNNVVDYPIYVVQEMFRNEVFPTDLIDQFERILLVVDAKVDEMYGDAIKDRFTSFGHQVETTVLRISERRKDLNAVVELATTFESMGIRRRKDLVVAVGGGVTMDVVGFAAGIFRRGIPVLKLPTTLLAAIDAGIGVKTGINFRGHKSRLGAYSAPYAVVVDTHFLLTLTDRQIRNGLSEALKIALVADRSLFELIDQHGLALIESKLQSQHGTDLINRAIRAMLLELSPNLHERVLDRLPDYGHTFSPVFEFELSDVEHGEAVALDMALATALSTLRGVLDFADAERILDTQYRLGLPMTRTEITDEMLRRGLCDATKHRGGRLRMPILRGIGDAIFVDQIGDEELADAISFLQGWAHARRQGQFGGNLPRDIAV